MGALECRGVAVAVAGVAAAEFFATIITTTLAAEIGVLDTTVKLLAYYGHERVGLRVGLGRFPKKDYQI